MVKYKIYNAAFVKSRIKNKILSSFKEQNSENLISSIDRSLSNFKLVPFNENNHASIYFQSIGKNSFINVLYNDRIIYNKTLGKFKIDNIKIKKKEKNFIRNLFSFSLEFANYFFKSMIYDYKIKTISVNYNCKIDTIYPFKKHLNYKIIGSYLKLSYSYNGVIYSERQYKKKEHLFILYSNPNIYNPYEEKMKGWLRLNFRKRRKHFFKSSNLIKLSHVNIINKYPYNGCKKKKIKKI